MFDFIRWYASLSPDMMRAVPILGALSLLLLAMGGLLIFILQRPLPPAEVVPSLATPHWGLGPEPRAMQPVVGAASYAQAPTRGRR